ncbi:MAG: glycosyltransferase [Gemmataceae bacterium]
MISFILPAHNEEAFLPAAIDSIHRSAKQMDLNYEVIVSNDASTDRTGEIASSLGTRVLDVNFRKIASVRNAGAKVARGEILFFMDSDTKLTTEALAESLQALKAGASGGGCHFNYDVKIPLWARILHPMGLFLGRIFGLVGGCAVFCWRKKFEEVGGFPEDYYAAEDVAFSRALKKTGRFVIPRARVTTSARKLWTMRPMKTTWLVLKLVFLGPSGFRKKQGLELWYEKHPDDPVYDQLRKGL